MRKTKRSWPLLAVGISLLGVLMLRLWGIAFAPTAPHARPDEDAFVLRAFDMYSGDQAFDLLVSGWPQGYFRIVHLLESLETAVLSLVWHHPVHLGCVYAVNPIAVQLWPRVFSALIDVVGCLLVGLTVRRLVPEKDRDVALPLGILALGCNYLATRDAHFGVSDATLLFTVCLCTYAAVRSVMDGPKYLPLVAIATGAGFGVKYAAAPLGATCMVALLCCLVRFKDRRRSTLWFSLLSVGAGALAFQLTSPGALIRFPDLWRSVTGHAERYGDAARLYLLDPDFNIGAGWRFHLFHNFPTAFGWPGFVLSIAGLLLCFRRDRYAGIVVAATTVASFVMLFAIRTLFVRYGGPVLPPLAVGLGLVLTASAAWMGRLLPRAWATTALALLLLLVFVFPVRLIVQFDRLMSVSDTRDQATEWLVQHHGSAVTEGGFAATQILDPNLAAACRPEVPPFLWRDVPSLPPMQSDWPQFIREGKGFWGAVAHNALENCQYSSPPREAAAFVVSGRGVLPCGKPGRTVDLPPLDPACYALETVFSPGNPECDGYLDLFDSMWLPYWGFGGWQHPGPRLEIYKNLCLEDG
jgi:hypothetical protein